MPREHCWHHTSGFTQYVCGYETEVCCFCGVSRTRKWTREDDPEHGRYNNPHIRRYEPAPDKGVCISEVLK